MPATRKEVLDTMMGLAFERMTKYWPTVIRKAREQSYPKGEALDKLIKEAEREVGQENKE